MHSVFFSGLRSADQGRQPAFPLGPGFNLGGMREPERSRWSQRSFKSLMLMNFDADDKPVDGLQVEKLPAGIPSEDVDPVATVSKTAMDWLAKGKRPVRPDGKSNFEYPHELKVEVVLEVFKENARQSEIGERYGVPQPLISLWRKTAIEGIVKSLDGKRRGRPPAARGFAVGEDLSGAEELVLRVGATLRENTKLLESTLQLILGRGTPPESEAADKGPA
jgi:transposase-like protein